MTSLHTLNIVVGIYTVFTLAVIIVMLGITTVEFILDCIPAKKENPDNLAFYESKAKIERLVKNHERHVKVKQTIAQCQNASEFVYLNK